MPGTYTTDQQLNALRRPTFDFSPGPAPGPINGGVLPPPFRPLVVTVREQPDPRRAEFIALAVALAGNPQIEAMACHTCQCSEEATSLGIIPFFIADTVSKILEKADKQFGPQAGVDEQ